MPVCGQHAALNKSKVFWHISSIVWIRNKINMASGQAEEMMGMHMNDENDGEEDGADADMDDCVDEKASGEITSEQREYIKQIYYHGSDKNKSGALSTAELRRGLQALGLNPTIQDVKNIMKKHDIDGRKVDYEQFERIVTEEAIGNNNAEFDLVEAFRIFDKDQSGTLERDELARCLSSLGEQLSQAELNELFDKLDTNKDGKLSLIEASKMLAN